MLRNLSMHACDFSMMPVKREQCVEKLSLNSVNQMKALMLVLSRNIGVGFRRRRCNIENNIQKRTFVSHGDNGKKIGPLPEQVSDHQKTLTRNFSKCVGTDFVYETNNETLKVIISYSHFTVQATVENIAIESLLFAQDEAQLEQVNLPIPVVNEEEE